MPITIMEKIESQKLRSGKERSYELVYQICGTASSAAALSMLEATAPRVTGGLRRRSCTVEPIYADAANPGAGIWEGVARYAPAEKVPPEDQQKTLTFDTSGGTQHITQSRRTVRKEAPPGQVAPDHQGAIGVTHGSVAGVDIIAPEFKFNVTLRIPAEKVTPAYIRKVFECTGKINIAPCNVWGLGNFQRGELLFVGAQGARRGDGDWEIQYSFLGSPNQEGIVIGDIVVDHKFGWEYLWVQYADVKDAQANVIVKRPIAAYVEEVYEFADFADLDPPE